jgi:hypothetical protein
VYASRSTRLVIQHNIYSFLQNGRVRQIRVTAYEESPLRSEEIQKKKQENHLKNLALQSKYGRQY